MESTKDRICDILTCFDVNMISDVIDDNKKYLEKTLVELETLRLKANKESTSADTSRARAAARDNEKTIDGLISGIKFSISFMHYKNKENLNADNIS